MLTSGGPTSSAPTGAPLTGGAVLTADQGSFTLTGKSASLFPRASKGSFTLTGEAANLHLNRNLSAEVGATYITFPGVAGNYASTPDSATVSITGDIDVRCKIAPFDWSPATALRIASKWDATGNQRSWNFLLNTSGTLQFQISPDGTLGSAVTATSTANLSALADGAVKWIRTTVDVNNGSGGADVKFYTSDDYNPTAGMGTWTQLGSTVTLGSTTSIFDSTANLQVGSINNAGSDLPYNGHFIYMEVRNGIDGTAVSRFNPARGTTGGTSWVAFTGETWTLHTSGTPAARLINGGTLLTGQVATLRAAHKLVASQGSFTLTGEDTPIYHGLRLITTKGDFTLTGEPADLFVRSLKGYTRNFRELTGSTTGEEPVYLVEISHPQLAVPVRIVNDTKDFVCQGNNYIACAFRVQFPEDMAQTQPRVPISIDNIGRELTQWLEASNGGKDASVRIMQVMRNTPDIIEQEYTLDLLDSQQDVQQVTANLGYSNVLDRPALLATQNTQYQPNIF